MAKFVLVCARRGADVPTARLRRACALMSPDNVQPAPPVLRTRDGVALALASPTPVVATYETSACVGQMFSPGDDWWVPRAAVPDGSFALVRADDAAVELATDAVASRSVFYAHTDELFVASSSQRAVAAVLGSFRLEPQAVSWMLSAGVLGPGVAWDSRVRRLGPDARVQLDRESWRTSLVREPVVFRAERRDEKEQTARLREAALWACDHVDLGRGTWRLPLSGGCDSRFLLLALSRRYRLTCLTWGVEAALREAENDAHIARRMAEHVGAPHEFFRMDASEEPLDVLVDRFLANGEGCVDHIGAYMDGFEVWRRLHDGGVAGIVRGDEGCGWDRVLIAPAVRWGVDAILLRDFWSRQRIRALGLAEQEWPSELDRGRGESIGAWRDRLYHAFRIPTFLASLTELKTPYVEVVNPLLSRRVLDVVRSLPDELRTDKRLFRQVVAEMSPPIPFATKNAIPVLRLLVGGTAFRSLAHAELLRGREEGSLPEPLAAELLRRLPPPSAPAARAAHERPPRAKEQLFALIRRSIPKHVRSAIRSYRPQPPSLGALAFRATIVSRMARTLARAAAIP